MKMIDYRYARRIRYCHTCQERDSSAPPRQRELLSLTVHMPLISIKNEVGLECQSADSGFLRPYPSTIDDGGAVMIRKRVIVRLIVFIASLNTVSTLPVRAQELRKFNL